VAEYVVLAASDGDGARLLRPAADRFVEINALAPLGLTLSDVVEAGQQGLFIDDGKTQLRLHQLDFHAVLHQQFRIAVAEYVVLAASDGDGARGSRSAGPVH
jgi:hypothetical protein